MLVGMHLIKILRSYAKSGLCNKLFPLRVENNNPAIQIRTETWKTKVGTQRPE